MKLFGTLIASVVAVENQKFCWFWKDYVSSAIQSLDIDVFQCYSSLVRELCPMNCMSLSKWNYDNNQHRLQINSATRTENPSKNHKGGIWIPN